MGDVICKREGTSSASEGGQTLFQQGRLPGGGNMESNAGSDTKKQHVGQVKKQSVEKRHLGLPGRGESVDRRRECRAAPGGF